MARNRKLVAALCLGTLVGCSSSDPVGSGSAGAPSSSAGASSAGASSAGASSAGAPSAGAPSAGASSAGAPSAGASSAGAPNTAGSGGASGGSHGGASGAGGGSAGAGTGGGSTGAADPSAGCSKPKASSISKPNEEILDVPASYDGMKPFPLLIAMHACGNPNNQWENLTKGSELESGYVRLMPNTTDSGQCWSNDQKNTARVLQQYDDALANYCIDKKRIFGVGHSSGAQFLVRMLADKTTSTHLALKAVAPVAADPAMTAINGPIPVLYIDGKNDNQRGPTSAKDTVAQFRTANQCMNTSKPYTDIMGCKSQQNQAQVDPGCIIYDGCAVPTIWCAHNDPNYNNTEHGVPCFGITSIVNFFKSM